MLRIPASDPIAMNFSSRPSTFVLAALALSAALGAGACASATAGTNETAEGDAVSSDSDLRASSCANPRRYFATFRTVATGTCDPIGGQHGRWVPEQPFPTAPARVQAAACGYRWSSPTNALPERDLLASRLGSGRSGSGLAPACGKGAQSAVGRVTPLPSHTKIIGGTVGCDVCGLVADGVLYVVLPPDQVAINQLEIAVADGSAVAFQIEPAATRALSIRLPAASSGASYAEGPVAIH